MKKYMIFAGSDYYPCGGIIDFEGFFDSKAEALDYAKTDGFNDWAQVIDTTTGEFTRYVDVDANPKIVERSVIKGWDT